MPKTRLGCTQMKSARIRAKVAVGEEPELLLEDVRPYVEQAENAAPKLYLRLPDENIQMLQSIKAALRESRGKARCAWWCKRRGRYTAWAMRSAFHRAADCSLACRRFWARRMWR